MKKAITSLLLCGSLVLTSIPFQVEAIDTVSVKLMNYLGNVNNINANTKGTYQIEGSSFSLREGNQYKLKLENGKIQLYENGVKKVANQTSIKIDPLIYGINNLVYISGKPYIGSVDFQIENGKYIRPINTLPFEDYLKGVVPNEMPSSWQLEALKAQAVSARTYAEKYGTNVMTDTQSNQVYGGYSWTTSTNKAVDETKGQYLAYGGNLADVFYSSSNGGKILSNRNSWGANLVPYLQTKDDPYDVRSGTSNVNWSYSLYKTQINLSGKDLKNPSSWWANISENVNNLTIINSLKSWMKNNDYNIPSGSDIKIISIPSIAFTTSFSSNDVLMGTLNIKYIMKKPSGYELDSNGNIKVIQATYNKKSYEIRNIIGTKIMKSPYIKSVVDNGTTIQVNGGGYGHGIGMSQYGAGEMAKEGFNYQQILNFYFPGTTINNASNNNIVIPSNLKLTLDHKMYLYDNPGDKQHSTTSISPQIVQAVAQWKNTQWYEINSWLGMKWINLQDPYQIEIKNDAWLYEKPDNNYPTGAKVGPQTLTVLGTQGEWYIVDTWLGQKYIKPTVVVNTENQTIITTETHFLYEKPYFWFLNGAKVAPQQLNYKEIEGNWAKIQTWLGDKYIELN